MLLEEERADRFGKSRSSGTGIWTRKQGDKLQEIQDEQSESEESEESGGEESTAIEDKFNQAP